MAAALARGKRGANNHACARNYLISKVFIFDGVKLKPQRIRHMPDLLLRGNVARNRQVPFAELLRPLLGLVHVRLAVVSRGAAPVFRARSKTGPALWKRAGALTASSA